MIKQTSKFVVEIVNAGGANIYEYSEHNNIVEALESAQSITIDEALTITNTKALLNDETIDINLWMREDLLGNQSESLLFVGTPCRCDFGKYDLSSKEKIRKVWKDCDTHNLDKNKDIAVYHPTKS